ncbi:MAG: hypothetical protein E6G60_07600 [Actinobacteria bacterium]|nr:MAG: hypothetical protein E6G60_07600 [Actinomycetota bacterium]
MAASRRGHAVTGAVLVAVVGLLVPARLGAAVRPAAFPLTRVRDVSLPGRATRFDYQSIDERSRRLYLAHLGDSTVVAVDLDRLAAVASVPGVTDVHGIIAAPDLFRVFATATGANELVAIDPDSHRVVARERTGEFPDGVGYDPFHHVVAVSNKDAGSVTLFHAPALSVIATIKLARETGNVVYDELRHVMLAAARPPEQLVMIDPARDRVVHRLRLTGCRGAHGVAISPNRQEAFVACEDNARMVTVRLAAWKQIATSTVGAQPDVLAVDPALERLYVASESGVVTVFATTSGAPRKLGQLRVDPHAHSVAVDLRTHRVFFPLQDVNGHPVLRVMRPSSLRLAPAAHAWGSHQGQA